MSHIALLRGINVGSTKRISMAELREAFPGSVTYLQSGNLVLPKRTSADDVRAVIADRFGLDVDVVTRSRAELAKVVARNPLPQAVADPKRYQVTFLDAPPAKDVVAKLESLRAGKEQLVVDGREVYAWHPAGVARSKLWAALAGRGLGVTATSRNWTTVTALLDLADRG